MRIGKGKSNIFFDWSKKLISRLKERKFGWLFVLFKERTFLTKKKTFGFYIFTALVIYIFGFSPFGFARNTIRAIMGVEVGVVDLYVGNARISGEQGDYQAGWWSEAQSLGEPDLGPDGELLSFNDSNSAFYSGGKHELILGDFLPSDEYSSEPPVINDEEIESVPDLVGDEIPADTNQGIIDSQSLIDDELATGTDEQLPVIESAGDEVSATDQQSIDDVSQEVDTDAPMVDDYNQVEVLEPVESETPADEGVVDVIEESAIQEQQPAADEKPEEVSWLHGVKAVFDKIRLSLHNYYAVAQSNTIELESFGNFESATIKLSLASASLAQRKSSEENQIEETDIELPVIDSGESSTTTDFPVDNENTTATGTQSRLDYIKDFFARSAKAQTDNQDRIVIWYSTDIMTGTSASLSASTSTEGILWKELGRISDADASNALHGGYFEYEADFLNDWADVKNLHLKLEGITEDDSGFVFYLDSAWVSAEYEVADDAPEKESLKRARWEEALEMLSSQTDFKIDEQGEIRFRYTKIKEALLSKIGEMLGWTNYWSDIDLRAELLGKDSEVLNLQPTLFFEDDGEFVIKLPDLPADFEPGMYKIKFIISDNSGDAPETIEITKNFSWGVLALNYDKSVYLPNERAYLQMAALDNGGHTLCDATLLLKITSPSGAIKELNTASGTIALSPTCGPETVTDTPDYFAYYDVSEVGQYNIELTAITKNGTRNIMDVLEVKDILDFEVQRVGATRIFPKEDYSFTSVIKVNADYVGDIVDSVPASFKIANDARLLRSGQELRITNSVDRDPFGANFKYEDVVVGDRRVLTWKDVNVLKGDILEIKYHYDAPNVSPEFYLLGPLTIGNFKEMRSWQIASDAVFKRAKTVAFMAGVYNGTGAVGQAVNTNNAFSNFNFKLAETGVTVKNAYIMFEAQFDAYASSIGNYTGYTLALDTCQESCTASSTSGSGRVVQTDSTVLAFDEGESNQIRLLFDVTSEAQLAAYTGGGVSMQASMLYNLAFPTAIANSIANAKAVLYVTYTYDSDTVNQTNTVSYPLDSTTGTDRGSRQASIGTCTLNSTCPLFDYKMEIPEFPTAASSTNRLSQWFKFYNTSNSDLTTDLRPNINIQGVNQDSVNFNYERALNGQAAMPAMYFPYAANLGYAENTSQQVEFNLNLATNFGMGGEVFETYVSSSSAATKTRTVSLPMGVVSNDAVNSLSSKEVGVYFPENGTATGTVRIKSAWVRLIVDNTSTIVSALTVSDKVGNNATSSDLVYNFDSGTTIVKSSFNLIHIIASSSYAELENANATTEKKIRINATPNVLTYGGISAELVITYTYTSEGNGYLTSLNLNGGQAMTAGNDQDETVNAANAVLPELNNKSVLAAGLLTSYHSNNSTANSMTTVNITKDANLSTSSPSCSNAYVSFSVNNNVFTEFYKDVTANLLTTDDQSYQTCMTNNGGANATTGAKMNSQLTYTYKWDNLPPTGVFNSATARRDGGGVVDLSIEVDDANDQDSRAKLEYATGTSCVFNTPGDPMIDESDANVTADFADPQVLNSQTYQIGTDANPIRTASGSNSVFVDWTSQSNLPNLEGDYCLRLTDNDYLIDQTVLATTTVYIDNLKPTAPGALSMNKRTGNSVTLNFGATSTETNFVEYKIFYKIHNGTDPTESDSVVSSSTESALGVKLFGKATTTVSSLSARTKYSFAIWAYDSYGNKASSSRVDIETNDPPTVVVNSAAQRTDASGIVDLSIDADDNNNDDTVVAKVDYVLGAACNFGTPQIPTLDTTQSNIQADWGTPSISNAREYQIGTTSSFIITSPGSNTIDFDWFGKTDLSSGNATYCVRLQVKDDLDSQFAVATRTVTIDNVIPTTPGNLTKGALTTNSIVVVFDTGNPAADTNPPTTDAYKIFYKEGTSGVTEGNTEHDLTALNAYNYNGATSSNVTGLNPNTDYVFNIWAYDKYGNKTVATEMTAKTNNTILNNSLTFVNPSSANIAVSNNNEWIFRAVVTEDNGWSALDNVKLRLADNADNAAPYGDLEFTWNQATNQFTETGSDSLNGVSLGNSSSNCMSNTCTLDFNLVFGKSFGNTNVDYDAGLLSTSDIARTDEDNYPAFYKVQKVFVNQFHYRWRNDDGGE